MNPLQYLFYPLSLLYGAGVSFRNVLYDQKIFNSVEFNVPTICVGNLSVGGTGKTPCVEYLLRLLSQRMPVATLSRGYGRKTRGFLIADQHTGAEAIGDEPRQFKLKFPHVQVTVGENRALAIPSILMKNPATRTIILDDAFQHRGVQAGLNILLTEYHQPYSRDFLLPVGRLREWRSAAQRAQIIIVTKCPVNLTETERNSLREELSPGKNQQVYFATLEYPDLYNPMKTNERLPLDKDLHVALMTGIANNEPLVEYIEQKSVLEQVHTYSDHHNYTIDELQNILYAFEQIDATNKILVTTEKDAMRLAKFASWFREKNIPIYCIPVEMKFLGKDAYLFGHRLNHFYKKYNIQLEEYVD